MGIRVGEYDLQGHLKVYICTVLLFYFWCVSFAGILLLFTFAVLFCSLLGAHVHLLVKSAVYYRTLHTVPTTLYLPPSA